MPRLALLTFITFSLILAAAAQAPAPFLWSYKPGGVVGTLYSVVTPYVLVVTQGGNNIIGLDAAAGKQRWAVSTANLSACPAQQSCYVFGTQFVYDNTTDLVFIALIAPSNASSLSIIAITSATGALKWNTSIPIDPEASTLYPYYAMTTGLPGFLFVWDSHLASLYAFNLSTGASEWAANATNQTLCSQALGDIGGVVSGPRGVTITYCGIGAYYAWDATGRIMWSNPGLPNGTDTWYYGPVFLSDGSFLVWKETPPTMTSPCRYSMSSNSFSLSWCATAPPEPLAWAGAPILPLPTGPAALSLTVNDADTDLIVNVATFSTQGGAFGWTGAAVANYSNEGYPTAWPPVVDPSDGSIYYAPADDSSLLYVIDPNTGATVASYALSDPSTHAIAATANAVYLASYTGVYALKTQ